MSNNIEVRFILGKKIKHFPAKTTSKVSELIERLKRINEAENVKIELFYGGRFLNPDFTLKQIKYNEEYPIYVFTSSDEYKKKYDELAVSQLLQSFSDNDTNSQKSAVLLTPDAEDRYSCMLMKLKSSIDPPVIHDLEDQAIKNNVDQSVMFLLYKKLGNNKEEALNFFNKEKKKLPKH